MRHIYDYECEVPTISVSPDVYDAILLAERVAVVTEAVVRDPALRHLFQVRRCIVPASGAAASPACESPGLLRLMVGG